MPTNLTTELMFTLAAPISPAHDQLIFSWIWELMIGLVSASSFIYREELLSCPEIRVDNCVNGLLQRFEIVDIIINI